MPEAIEYHDLVADSAARSANPLKLTTSVQEKHAGIIRIGTTRTFVIEAELPNRDHRLKPGVFAKGASLSRMDDHVIAAPEEAVATLAGLSMVFVVEHGTVRPQNVTLGVHQGTLLEITSGLQGGETLAASDLSRREEGMAIVARGTGTGNANSGRGAR